MSRMIPGRIRNQGIELYRQGLVEILDQGKDSLSARIEGHLFQYATDDSRIICDCQLFAKKKYCQHLAAIEYFLKNDSQGKAFLENLEESSGTDLSKGAITSFGSLFLDNLRVTDDEVVTYRLSAHGQPSSYTQDYQWTLKINRLPDNRSYIIRDIKTFLLLIANEEYYQIGKNYFERLALLKFDEPSQDLIHFLWRLLPDDTMTDVSYLFPDHGRHLALTSGIFEEGIQLFLSLHDFSFEDGIRTYDSLRYLPLSPEDEMVQFQITVHQSLIELIVTEKPHQSLYDNKYILVKNTLYSLTLKQQKIWRALRTLPIDEDLKKHIRFHLDDQAKLAAHLLDFAELGHVEAPKAFDIRDFEVMFAFDMTAQKALTLQLTFDYDGILVSSREELAALPFASHYKHERLVFKQLEKTGFSQEFFSQIPPLHADELYAFFTERLPEFERLGEVVLSSSLSKMRIVEQAQVSVRAEADLLGVSFDFSQIGPSDIDKAVEALFNQEAYFVNPSGQLVVFDEETQRVSQTLKELRAQHQANGQLTLDTLAAYQLSHLLADQTNVSFSQKFEQLAYDLTHPEQFATTLPAINTSLRDYQRIGFNWLAMLDFYGFGGILADDMGLGKTLQTIAFLAARMTETKKALILAPSGLIYNWQDEFEKFAPDLDVTVSYGTKANREEVIAANHQIIITSYASFRQDIDLYLEQSFDYLILDEAQVMKNTQTKIAQYLREFPVKTCFALSGTPIENKLQEIWSIFQIVLPGLLPPKRSFLKMEPKQVARQIKPFIMRRRKEEVLPELPDLIEINYTNELADSQKAIYLAQLIRMQEKIASASDAELNRQKIEILSGITRLRQICDTPSLFMDYQGDSGKVESLRSLLLQIKESGHRPLIFSQFRGMLDIAEKEIATLGMTSYKITGSTSADLRQEMTRAFNAGSRDSFLISLKAGGVGLNLTGADTVVLIDLWWNPAVEMQAISRAHRLGQEKNVEVYRLITRGTIEEKILTLQENKKNLVATVLDGNETRSNLSVEDIKEILGISQES